MKISRYLFMGILLGLILFPLHSFAASCPCCGRTYGAAMPGDESRVNALRAQHEASCCSTSDSSGSPSGSVIAYPHGHYRHRCTPRCEYYRYPHGHQMQTTSAETSRGYIRILEFESGKGNFFRPKVTATVEVLGPDISILKLWGVSSTGQFNELQTLPVKHRENVSLRAVYPRNETKRFELRLYDNKGNVVARKLKLPE